MHLSDDDKISFMEQGETMNLSKILPEPHSDWELHTDGWYMFVTDRANFNHYLEFARQAVEDE